MIKNKGQSMSVWRRILSHLLISMAVFCLSSTLIMFFIDGFILNSKKLTTSLQSANVSKELATIIPDIASKDANGSDKEDIKSKIRQVITYQYIDRKMSEVASTIITYVREGSPEPVIDLSDFPEQLRASGVETGKDIEEKFSQPIVLNDEGKLDKIPSFYRIFNNVKIGLIVVSGLLFLAEWFVAIKGEKLKRIGRVFMHVSIWFFLIWGVVIFLPGHFTNKLEPSADMGSVDPRPVVKAAVSAAQSLLGTYTLTVAISFGVVAVGMYAVRRFVHVGDVSKDQKTQKTAKSQPKGRA